MGGCGRSARTRHHTVTANHRSPKFVLKSLFTHSKRHPALSSSLIPRSAPKISRRRRGTSQAGDLLAFASKSWWTQRALGPAGLLADGAVTFTNVGDPSTCLRVSDAASAGGLADGAFLGPWALPRRFHPRSCGGPGWKIRLSSRIGCRRTCQLSALSRCIPPHSSVSYLRRSPGAGPARGGTLKSGAV